MKIITFSFRNRQSYKITISAISQSRDFIHSVQKVELLSFFYLTFYGSINPRLRQRTTRYSFSSNWAAYLEKLYNVIKLLKYYIYRSFTKNFTKVIIH